MISLAYRSYVRWQNFTRLTFNIRKAKLHSRLSETNLRCVISTHLLPPSAVLSALMSGYMPSLQNVPLKSS